MLNVNSEQSYNAAIEALRMHKNELGNILKGRFVQIFFALKCFQNEIPSMWSGKYIATNVLQTLIDDLYTKASRPLNDCVISLFQASYLARTGVVGIGNTTTQNTWRNNFNIQKGIGCYAPVQDLCSLTFLNEDRSNCRYLQHGNGGGLAGGTCTLCVNSGNYRAESHRKWLKISADGEGYSTADLRMVDNFTPYIAPNNSRIPIFPFVAAVYYDSQSGTPISGRDNIGIDDFASDFNLSQEEINAYFNADPEHPLNARVIATQPAATLAVELGGITPAVVPQQPTAPVQQQIGEPILGVQVPPPVQANTGAGAEVVVGSALENNGWEVHDVSRQKLGYDLYAKKGREIRYVEVKSSLSLCQPVLTSREWQQANSHAAHYVLAVVENYNPEIENIVYWVSDPANRCIASTRVTTEYSIPRRSWSMATISIDDI